MSVELMKGAALDALERLHGVLWQMDLRTLYAPLSECLVWATAIADYYGRLEEPRYSGIAYARNCVLHGVQVVTFVEELGPWEQPTIVSSAGRFHGNSHSRQWGFAPDPEPHDPTAGRAERHANRRKAYNESVAGRDIHLVVDSAMWGVGVNIWALGHTPLQRRSRPGAGEGGGRGAGRGGGSLGETRRVNHSGIHRIRNHGTPFRSVRPDFPATRTD